MRRALAALAALALAGHAALPCAAATPATAPASPPSQMMANVYRLTEAAALLTACMRSESYGKLPPEKAAEVNRLLERFGALVQAIGRHYRDDGLQATYDATREKIAGENATIGYAKTRYRYCGDALLADMGSYLAENEKLINGYFARQAPAGKPQPRP
jgi:hypothetical protein